MQLNVTFDTSIEKRCPHCKQNHLTPGYCQALDPANADKYPHLHSEKPETLSVVETDNETLTETLVADETLSQCTECSKPFQSSRSSARYCSSACRLKAHRRTNEKSNASA